jgi:hypothetical protein
MMRIALALVILIVLNAPAFSHSWYDGLHNEKGYTCCGGNDCAPLADGDVVERSDGYWINSKAVLVPLNRAKPALEEDGHYHACFWGDPSKDTPPEPANMPKCFFYPNRGY